MDSSAIHALEEIVELYRSVGKAIYFAGVKGPVRDAMTRGHIIEILGKDHFFMNKQAAVDGFLNKNNDPGSSSREDYLLQNNV